MNKTYSVIGNRTAADVVARNDEVIATGLEMEEARRVAITAQKSGEFIAAWIEAEIKPAKTAPKITRTVESDYRGHKHTVSLR